MNTSPKSKDYGVLTVNTKYYGKAKKLFDVPNTSFIPAPNVTSSIVKIDICKRYVVQDEKTFFKLVKASFAQRRKKLLNSIENSNVFNIEKEQLSNILTECGIKENARAEEIDLETYVEISARIYDIIKKSEN